MNLQSSRRAWIRKDVPLGDCIDVLRRVRGRVGWEEEGWGQEQGGQEEVQAQKGTLWSLLPGCVLGEVVDLVLYGKKGLVYIQLNNAGCSGWS